MRAFLAALALSVAAQVAHAADMPAGASSCSGCHAESAQAQSPVPPLAGRDPAKLVAAMRAFRSGERPATVMDRIAKGYSDEETAAIAAWFGAQARR
ncbi:MAG: cytochrome [Rhodospirillales bacterium]|nr:cytochrome [Rhodospirillales bacterium]